MNNKQKAIIAQDIQVFWIQFKISILNMYKRKKRKKKL